jgi:hypothetical protein
MKAMSMPNSDQTRLSLATDGARPERPTPSAATPVPHDERLALALSGVLASLSNSAAWGSRLQRSAPRAAALGQVAAELAARQAALQRFSEQLSQRAQAAPTAEPELAPAGAGKPPQTPQAVAGSEAEQAVSRVQISLPHLQHDVGLGDVLKKLTGAFGIRACSACEKRAEALNRALQFRGARRPQQP